MWSTHDVFPNQPGIRVCDNYLFISLIAHDFAPFHASVLQHSALNSILFLEILLDLIQHQRPSLS